MKAPLILAFAAVIAIAGCNEDDETTASCTMEELQSKSVEVAAGLQENPAMAAELASSMAELAPRLQETLASGGEPDEETLGELCAAYDELIAKF